MDQRRLLEENKELRRQLREVEREAEAASWECIIALEEKQRQLDYALRLLKDAGIKPPRQKASEVANMAKSIRARMAKLRGSR